MSQVVDENDLNMNVGSQEREMSGPSKVRRKARRSYVEASEEDEEAEAEAYVPEEDVESDEIEVDEETEEEVDEEQEEQTSSKRKRASSSSKSNKATRGTKEEYAARRSRKKVGAEVGAESSDDDENSDTKAGGVITSVYVENFMNHRKLSVNLNSSLNFITGKNGSGKSAIATALMICLGSRASATGRGSSLSGLIREGSNANAKVQVKLKNEGADAYKPELFGEQIIVERIISRSGSAKLNLLHGKKKTVISTERWMLHKILEAFGTQVDNPCCVLTQENSKKFIKGKEEDKYDFFMKATGLAPMYEEIVQIRDTREATQKALDKAAGKLEGLRKDAQDKKADMKRLKGLGEIENSIRLCAAKAYWIDVKEAREVMDSINEKLAGIRDAAEKTAKALAEAEANVGKETTVDELEAEVREISRQKEEFDGEMDAKRELEQSARQQVNKLSTALRNIKSKIREYDDQHAVCLENIEKIKSKAKGSAEAARKVLYDREDGYKKNKTRILEGLSRVEKEVESLEADRQRQDGEMKAHRRVANELKRQCEDIERQLKDAKGGSGGGVEGRIGAIVGQMGPKAKDAYVRAYRAIQQDSQLKGVIIGPVGTLLTLRPEHKRYKDAVHHTLMPVRAAFINTSNDKRVMDRAVDIMRKNGCRGEIINQPKSKSYSLPSLGYDNAVTVMDALNINMPDGQAKDQVRNLLTDRIGWHLRVLVKTETDYKPFMTKDDRGRERWISSQQKDCIAADRTVISVDRLGNRVRTPAKGRESSYLSEDAKELVAELEEALGYARGEMDAHDREEPTAVSVNGQINKLRSDQNRLEGELREVGKDLKKVGHELRESEEAEKGDDTTAYEEELGELRVHKAAAQGELEGMESDLREKRAYADGIKTELNSIAAREEELKVLMETKETALAEEIKRVQNAERVLTKLRKDDAASKATREASEKLAAERQEDFEAVLSKAEEQTRELVRDWDGQPIELDRKDTKVRLASQAKAATEHLEAEKARNEVSGLTLEVAAERYKAAKGTYTSAVETHNLLTEQIEKMTVDEGNRKRAYRAHLDASARRVDMLFTKYLSAKGFSGDIHFEHPTATNELQRGRLHLRVNKDGNDLGDGTDTKGGDVRQLSGGERSFTTLCLLLALGHVVDAPFRVMDEYDVFLDEMSRKITLDQIVEYALDVKQSSKQFIVITPNNLKDIRTGHRCKIIAMQNPERRSATGPQQRTID